MNGENDILSLQAFAIDGKTPLDFSPDWPDRAHQFERREAVAIQAALLSGRPLLVEGPPGSGKTQIAAAAASVLGRELIAFVVNSNTRPEDLLWQYDALQRLNDAQAKKLGLPKDYLSKGPLWLALDSGDDHSKIPAAVSPYKPRNKQASGKVVLLDEIDKADRSVPNSLLEVLGQQRFYCPYVKKEIGLDGDAPPLIVITSNREQQLPPAFVRRCLVLRVGLPDDEGAFVEKLSRRAQMHFDNDNGLSDHQYREVARALWKYRQNSGLAEEMQPGQAEYFDLVRAISGALKQGLTREDGAPLSFDDLMDDMRGLAFDKRGLGDRVE